MDENQNQTSEELETNTDESDNLRAAFAIVGSLIGRGAIKVAFENKYWHDEFRLNVECVLRTLEALELGA